MKWQRIVVTGQVSRGWRTREKHCRGKSEERRALLQKANLSGECYDYEVITDNYEDYWLGVSWEGRLIPHNGKRQKSCMINWRNMFPLPKQTGSI